MVDCLVLASLLAILIISSPHYVYPVIVWPDEIRIRSMLDHSGPFYLEWLAQQDQWKEACSGPFYLEWLAQQDQWEELPRPDSPSSDPVPLYFPSASPSLDSQWEEVLQRIPLSSTPPPLYSPGLPTYDEQQRVEVAGPLPQQFCAMLC